MARISSSRHYAFAVTVAMLGAACVTVTAAHADTIYRSIGADGDVTYSSQPVPGARENKAIKIDSLSPEERRASLLLRREQQVDSAEVAAPLQARERQWRQADREITSSQNALAKAETALQNGRTPLPGERRGNVGGGSRLSEAYFQRLRKLGVQVNKAKERLDRAYGGRNALR